MNKRKLLIFLYLVLLTAFIFSLPSYSACSSRQLNKVCVTCRNGALNSSQCMATPTSSTCPSCPTTTCPTSPTCPPTTTVNCPVCPSCPPQTSCPTLEETNQGLQKFLASSYRVTLNVIQGQTDNFQLTIFGRDNVASFKYDVTDLSTFKVLRNGAGSIYFGEVSFLLPLNNGGFLFPIECVGVVNKNSVITGNCVGIQTTSDGNFKIAGGQFTAFPN